MVVRVCSECAGRRAGGAVINEAGQLVGILVGSRGNYDNFSIAVPIDALKLEETLNETKL